MSIPDDFLGYLAASMTTTAFVPQVLQTIRTRDTRAISLGMYLLFCGGVMLWAVYGVLTGAWPIIVANVVTLLLTLVVLGYKLTEANRP
jgi:MtN3 and saliva related transmembrane protein